MKAKGKSQVTHKEQCPKCASTGGDKHGDNLSVYDDGHAYCFKCSHLIKGGKMGNADPIQFKKDDDSWEHNYRGEYY